MKKILIIAGGTGGHIFPALVIASLFQKEGIEVQWLGAEGGMERTLVTNQYPIFLLPVQAMRNRGLLGKIRSFFGLCRSLLLSIKLIYQYQPDVVLGMGGYASGPGGFAAWLLRKPLVIHEQNAVAGWTNRILSRFASSVLQAFPNAFSKKISVKTVGNPVRNELYNLPDPTIRFSNRALPLRILVLGGSQGAHAINLFITSLLPLIQNKVNVLFWHQTGKRDIEIVQKSYASYPHYSYRIEPFIVDMTTAYSWADLVICRAGALTVSELSAVGLGSLLIPFPYAVDDHQQINARTLEKAGAGIVMLEKDLSAEKVITWLDAIQKNLTQLMNMAISARQLAKPSAASLVVSVCHQTAKIKRKNSV